MKAWCAEKKTPTDLAWVQKKPWQNYLPLCKKKKRRKINKNVLTDVVSCRIWKIRFSLSTDTYSTFKQNNPSVFLTQGSIPVLRTLCHWVEASAAPPFPWVEKCVAPPCPWLGACVVALLHQDSSLPTLSQALSHQAMVFQTHRYFQDIHPDIILIVIIGCYTMRLSYYLGSNKNRERV